MGQDFSRCGLSALCYHQASQSGLDGRAIPPVLVQPNNPRFALPRGSGVRCFMNAVEQAVLRAISGASPSPFTFRGKAHKSQNRIRWERNEEIHKRKKAEKQARRKARKQEERREERTFQRLLDRCQILKGETAADAKQRSIGESMMTQRLWYRQVYLLSQHWKHLRGLVLKAPDPVCSDCEKTKRLDVHHLNYRNIFDVTPADLQILCRRCHKKRHKEP